MITQEQLSEHATLMTTDIKAWCRQQAELWQKIPNLCLDAYQGQGFYDRYLGCARSGYWEVRDLRSNYEIARVDCESGEIQGTDASILRLSSQLDTLNAQTILNALLANKSKGRLLLFSETSWNQLLQERETLRSQLGLSPNRPYSRIRESAV